MRVIVIGAGVIGTTTAWFLATHGHEVTLVDRASGAGRETSLANGGLLHASHAEPWNAPGVVWQLLRWIGREESPLLIRPSQIPRLTRWGLGFLRYSRRTHHEQGILRNARLAVYSQQVLHTLRRDTGIRYDDSQNGIIKIFRSQESLDKAMHSAKLTDALGVRYSALGGRQAVALEPALGDVADELVGAVYYPDDESGDAHLFTSRLADMAVQRGVTLNSDTSVTGVVRSGDRIRHLRTSQGTLEADAYVLAAGSWSPQLARQAGFHLPIYPVKGYSVTLPLAGWNNAPAIPMIDDANKIVLSILGDRVRVAGTAEFAGHDLSLRPQRAHNVLKQALKTFPSLETQAHEDMTGYWCGLRPVTMDGPPILGRSPLSNLYLNCGPGHLGWTFACGAGKLVADLMSGQEPELDMDAYSLKRYRWRQKKNR